MHFAEFISWLYKVAGIKIKTRLFMKNSRVWGCLSAGILCEFSGLKEQVSGENRGDRVAGGPHQGGVMKKVRSLY